MVFPFDIFQSEDDGSVLWCESAETLEAAKARVRELVVGVPVDYILFNQQTGTKLVVRLGLADVQAFN
jgi:hypothetical protein